jgi:heterodisulfide reductase subunit A-like polyferredoxin
MSLRYIEDTITLKLDVEKCNGCRMCMRVCPHGVFAMNGKRASLLDKGACMECGACAMNCPEEAISVESGVGCATGVIYGYIKGTDPVCGCSDDSACC